MLYSDSSTQIASQLTERLCLHTSPPYLHHDSHPQRVFSYVFFAFFARRAATFGVFYPVQLVLLWVCHSWFFFKNKTELHKFTTSRTTFFGWRGTATINALAERSPRACREKSHVESSHSVSVSHRTSGSLIWENYSSKLAISIPFFLSEIWASEGDSMLHMHTS